LGFAFVPPGCGGVPPVTEVPENIAEPLKACAFNHERHLGDGEHTVKFEVNLDSDGRVDSLALVDSDVGDEELEKCLAAAIRSLSVDDLPLRSAENLERDPAPSQSRNLLGTPAIPLAACLASPPCLLTLGLVAGAAMITVQISVLAASRIPRAKPTATTTAPPIPIARPRRYPGQTCEDEELDEVEGAMKDICKQIPGKSCSPQSKNAPFLPEYPCSLLKARIPAMLVCIAARQKVQDECFKNSPHVGHEQQIDDLTKGVAFCEALKVVNCAPGHPMSGL
jgi:hypothetical protein